MPPSTVYRKKQELEALAEAKYQEAIAGLRNGTYKNITAAAQQVGVKSYVTLRRRYLGLNKPRTKAHANVMLLSPAQEDVLCDWIKYLGATSHAVSKRTIVPKVDSLCGKKPSAQWIQRFLKRRPDVVLGRPTGLDPKRAQAFNFTTVNHHFQLLRMFIEEHQIPWENIYNMDEKGIQLGGGRNGNRQKYFYLRDQRAKVKTQSRELELVTIVECISADGASLKPAFVFQGVDMFGEWFAEPGTLITTSENGWTSNFIGLQWFEHIFIPGAKAHNTSGRPILLIYDGHGSHTADQMREIALKEGIHLFCLPPHTTHRLQPLDVGVFGPTQRAWQRQCEAVLLATEQGIPLCDVVKEYMLARNEAFKEETILQAWKRTGIRPLNPNIFMEVDFAPSYSTSTITCLPASFPINSDAPDLPDLSSDDNWFDLDDPAPKLEGNDSSDSDTSSDIYGSGTDEEEEEEPGEGGPAALQGAGHQRHPITPLPFPSSASASIIDCFRDDTPSHTEPHVHPQGLPLPPIHTQWPVTPARPIASILTPPTSSSHRHRTHSIAHFLSTPTPAVRSNAPLSDRVAFLEAENARMQECIADLTYSRDAASAHAVFAHSLFQETQKKLNAKANKKNGEGRQMRTTSQVLTSEEGLVEWEADKQRRAEKQQKAEEVMRRKEAAEIEKHARRAIAGDTTVFGGSLNPKKKDKLEDIAIALLISKDGTKVVLAQRITKHLNAHPELSNNARFSGLFASLTHGQKHSAAQALLDTPSTAPGISLNLSSLPASHCRHIDENTPASNTSNLGPATPATPATPYSYGFYQVNHEPLSPTAGPSQWAFDSDSA